VCFNGMMEENILENSSMENFTKREKYQCQNLRENKEIGIIRRKYHIYCRENGTMGKI